MRMVWTGLAIIAAILSLAVGYALFSGWQFETRIASLKARLSVTSPGAEARPELPDIVRAFAERNGGVSGTAGIVHVTHAAQLSTAIGSPPISISADQWASAAADGIVWRGQGRMLGLPVVVVDSYVDGEGYLEARLAGAIKVAGGAGPDFDKGELQRYLSELPALPDAILNNAGLAWRVLDAMTVEVTAHSASGAASVRFGFDAAGDIVAIEADDRPMAVDGTTRPTRWIGSFSDYRQFGRYRVPAHSEVGWMLPDGLFTYWRGEITSYEAAPAD